MDNIAPRRPSIVDAADDLRKEWQLNGGPDGASTPHTAIMNIQVSDKVKAELEGAPKGFYLLGHRDARHAAAELVNAAAATAEQSSTPVPSVDVGTKSSGCPCDPSGSDGQRCPDASGKLLCAAPAVPEGVDTAMPRAMAWFEDGRVFYQFGEPEGFAKFYSADQLAQQREAGRREAEVPNLIECLREAMDKVNVPSLARAELVGHFSNAWNKRLPAPVAAPAARQPVSALTDEQIESEAKNYALFVRPNGEDQPGDYDVTKYECREDFFNCVRACAALLAASPKVEPTEDLTGARIEKVDTVLWDGVTKQFVQVVKHHPNFKEQVSATFAHKNSSRFYDAADIAEVVAELDILRMSPKVEPVSDDQRDAERLDWIEQAVREKGYCYIHSNRARFELIGLGLLSGSLREAIDRCRAATQPQPKPETKK